MKLTGNELIDQEIGKQLGEDETVLLADGLESAFLGIGRQFSHAVAIYSYKKTIKNLMRQGMDREEAIEYFDYNIAGAFVGDQTPVFLQDEWNPESVKVSIRTTYRIVKKTEDKDSDPIFIPQYQDEETGEQWHNFKIPIKGRSGGANPVYFYTMSKAMDYVSNQQALEDTVVLQTPKKLNYEEEKKHQCSYRMSKKVCGRKFRLQTICR